MTFNTLRLGKLKILTATNLLRGRHGRIKDDAFLFAYFIMWKSFKYSLRDKRYSFIAFLGWLSSKPIDKLRTINDNGFDSIALPHKCAINITAVTNPFMVSKTNPAKTPIIGKFTQFYAQSLIWLSRNCYPALYILSFLRLNIFNNGEDANEAFRLIHPSQQDTLCLSRSIFIATTSRQFKTNGTLFIGCFFPTRSLHAWVMENGKNVCRQDVYWTNYRPIAIMY